MIQANSIADKLKKDEKIKQLSMIDENIDVNHIENKEIIAVIAYLQRIGKDIKAEPKPITANTNQ